MMVTDGRSLEPMWVLASLVFGAVGCDSVTFTSAPTDAASSDASAADARDAGASIAFSCPTPTEGVYCTTFDRDLGPIPDFGEWIPSQTSSSMRFDDAASVSPPRSLLVVTEGDGSFSARGALTATFPSSTAVECDFDWLLETSVAGQHTALWAIHEEVSQTLLVAMDLNGDGATSFYTAGRERLPIVGARRAGWNHAKVTFAQSPTLATVTTIVNGERDDRTSVAATDAKLLVSVGPWNEVPGWGVRLDNVMCRRLTL